jgi:hypothetical protein
MSHKGDNFMNRPFSTVLALAVLVTSGSIAFSADVIVGDFEGATIWGSGTGWVDHNELVEGTIGTKGVTHGTQSLKWQPPTVGWYQELALKLWNIGMVSPTREAEAWQGALNNTHIAFDVTWDATPAAGEWVVIDPAATNYSELRLWLNHGPAASGGAGFVSLEFPDTDTGNPGNPGRWDNTNYPALHTRTVMWDYSQYLPTIQAAYNAGTIDEDNNWLEFWLGTNSNESRYSYPVTYYIDNVRFTTPVTGTPGDFNRDGMVDAADYTVWRDNLGATDESSISDNGDGMGGVDPADYGVWKTNFGQGPGAGGASAGAVPEPGTWLLGVAAIALLAAVRARR